MLRRTSTFHTKLNLTFELLFLCSLYINTNLPGFKTMHSQRSQRNQKKTFSSTSTSSGKVCELSVKCPQFYKDSVSADIMECLCPSPQHKTLIIASTIERAEWYYSSDYLQKRSILLHSGQGRRERIKTGKIFQQNIDKKCLIIGSICGTNLRKIPARLIIFTFPPQNVEIYQSVLDWGMGTEYVAICYSTKEITNLCAFQSGLNRRFLMLAPPDVESDSEEEMVPTKQSFNKFSSQHKVVVKNIGDGYNWKDLKSFLELSDVRTVDVRLVQSSRPSPRMPQIKTGFVICSDKRSYDNAMALNGSNFHGRLLKISEYSPSK